MLSFIRYFIFLFIATKIYSQVSVTSDLSSNYANSQNDYNYFENLMNINVASGNYMGWIELEFSNPPILGLDYKGIRKLRLDYIGDITQLKIGDLYEYWGNGMILNSVDDKSIDLDTGEIANGYADDKGNVPNPGLMVFPTWQTNSIVYNQTMVTKLPSQMATAAK